MTETFFENENQLEDSYFDVMEEVEAEAEAEAEVEEEVEIIDFRLKRFLESLSSEESRRMAIEKSQELGNSNWIGHSRYRKFCKSLY